MNKYREKLLRSVGLDTTIENIENGLPFIWSRISSHRKMNDEFIREFADNLNWGDICSTKRLSDEILLEFGERIPWNIYLRHFSVPFNILKKFITKSSIRSLDYVATYTLSDLEKEEIQRVLDFKYMFEK